MGSSSGNEYQWSALDIAITVLSCVFIAIFLIFSFCLLMAICERCMFKPQPLPSLPPQSHSDTLDEAYLIELNRLQMNLNLSILRLSSSLYGYDYGVRSNPRPREFPVLMPGDSVPRFIARESPLPCSSEPRFIPPESPLPCQSEPRFIPPESPLPCQFEPRFIAPESPLPCPSETRFIAPESPQPCPSEPSTTLPAHVSNSSEKKGETSHPPDMDGSSSDGHC